MNNNAEIQQIKVLSMVEIPTDIAEKIMKDLLQLSEERKKEIREKWRKM